MIGRAVHIWLNRPTMEAKFFGAFKKALAPGTNRDLKVVTKLNELWGLVSATSGTVVRRRLRTDREDSTSRTTPR